MCYCAKPENPVVQRVAMRPVSIIGVGMTPFGKQPDVSLGDLARGAVESALVDAGLDADRIDRVFFGNAIAGLITGQEMVRGQVALQGAGIDGLPVVNVENACASGSSAVHLAWMSVASGVADIALAVGAEKMTHPDRATIFAAIGTATDVERAALEQGTDDMTAVVQIRSPFMDIYAGIAERYMASTDASVEDLAEVSRKNHAHGSLNEKAQFGSAISVEEILNGRVIAGPLTLYMCSPVSDGAAAVLLASPEAAVALAEDQPAVYFRASAIVSGRHDGKGENAQARCADAAYTMARLGPDSIDVAEVHDATSVAELIAYEDLGFGPRGTGAQLLRSGATALDGALPVNTSGGLLSRGHPIGATGVAQLVELTQQLQGRAQDRQVKGASVGLASNGGGWLFGDAAAEVVTILATDPGS